MESDKKYFVLDGEENKGPFSFDEVLAQEITPETYLWYYGLDGWKYANELDEFRDYFASITPPPPIPKPVEPTTVPKTVIEGVEKPFESAMGEAENTTIAIDYTNQQAQAPYGPFPENYLAYSIIVTLIMCLPIGVVAIYYSTQVHPLYFKGDVVGALKASQSAKQWCTIGFIIAAIFWVCLVFEFVF